MEVDASDYTMEGVLSIDYKDGRWRPVVFLSKFLNETERNYKRNVSSNIGVRKLETFIKGCKIQVRGLDIS